MNNEIKIDDTECMQICKEMYAVIDGNTKKATLVSQLINLLIEVLSNQGTEFIEEVVALDVCKEKLLEAYNRGFITGSEYNSIKKN
ncbi:hypothetical protein [Mahella australiensis]|uniref:DNA polymerase III, beta subunit n=1 Tax=Mahella australiensis (strain DSM 15567 / CIP 107919 / 50-1 BON) TaxID=697281 RepID=F3ZY03_MAHA5|nr:hypothetical protein [Mahella australiensis]AEE97699.1 DNA polymerase III, beta subunit [Mahella australiensis 50-1 BON]